MIRLRVDPDATPTELRASAQTAARLDDLLAHITTAHGLHVSASLADENRVWDPGD